MDLKNFLRGPKLIFVILIVIILVEVILAVRYLKQSPPPPPLPTVKPISGARIILATPKKEYKVGETIPVSVRISTGGHPTDGTDLVLKFDQRMVEASNSGLLRGKVYAEYPMMAVDSKNGLIRISGIASGRQSNFNGVGVFAVLNLKAKQPGRTTLTVDFAKSKTNDSTILETKTAKDLLEGVTNLDLVIQ